MKLEKVAGRCESAVCPAVYTANNGEFIVQGRQVPPSDVEEPIEVPPYEALVAIPQDLLIDFVKRNLTAFVQE